MKKGPIITIITIVGGLLLVYEMFRYILGDPLRVFSGPDTTIAVLFLLVFFLYVFLPIGLAALLGRVMRSKLAGVGLGLLLGSLITGGINLGQLYYKRHFGSCSDLCGIENVLLLFVNGGFSLVGFGMLLVAPFWSKNS